MSDATWRAVCRRYPGFHALSVVKKAQLLLLDMCPIPQGPEIPMVALHSPRNLLTFALCNHHLTASLIKSMASQGRSITVFVRSGKFDGRDSRTFFFDGLSFVGVSFTQIVHDVGTDGHKLHSYQSEVLSSLKIIDVRADDGSSLIARDRRGIDFDITTGIALVCQNVLSHCRIRTTTVH